MHAESRGSSKPGPIGGEQETGGRQRTCRGRQVATTSHGGRQKVPTSHGGRQGSQVSGQSYPDPGPHPQAGQHVQVQLYTLRAFTLL